MGKIPTYESISASLWGEDAKGEQVFTAIPAVWGEEELIGICPFNLAEIRGKSISALSIIYFPVINPAILGHAY